MYTQINEEMKYCVVVRSHLRPVMMCEFVFVRMSLKRILSTLLLLLSRYLNSCRAPNIHRYHFCSRKAIKTNWRCSSWQCVNKKHDLEINLTLPTLAKDATTHVVFLSPLLSHCQFHTSEPRMKRKEIQTTVHYVRITLSSSHTAR